MSAPRPPIAVFVCPLCQTGFLQAMRCPTCLRASVFPLPGTFGAGEWTTDRQPDVLFACHTALDGVPTDRKRRLLHAAVARNGFGWYRDERFWALVRGAELMADGWRPSPDARPLPPAARAGSETADALRVAAAARGALGWHLRSAITRQTTLALYADAYRELFPNPFVPLAWNPDWFAPTARDLARHIYDNHDFGAMPILADALQDAGCDEEQVLTHCRADKPHARGCWVLDAVLRKS